MDLIGALAAECDLSRDRATALAGAFLGMLHEELEDRFGLETARSFEAELPEYEQWRVEALRWLGRAGGTTHGRPRISRLVGPRNAEEGTISIVGSSGAAGGDAGPQEALVLTMLHALYESGGKTRIGVEAETLPAPMVPPLMLLFLQKRLSPLLLEQVLQVAPVLRRIQQEGGSGLGGALGAKYGGLPHDLR